MDFASFGDMVDAVGGVPVCVPEDIVDREHQIFVPKGNPSVLSGDEALDYVRARYVGEQLQQNDISRIRRQQEFIGALVREVQSAGTLTRLDKVVKFLDAATKSLTTDEEFASVTRLGKVAMQLQNIGLDKVQFVTLPTEYYPRDSEFWGKVYWTPEAEQIWKLINEDKVIPPRLLGGNSVSAEGPPGSSETPSPSADGESPSETPSETRRRPRPRLRRRPRPRRPRRARPPLLRRPRPPSPTPSRASAPERAPVDPDTPVEPDAEPDSTPAEAAAPASPTSASRSGSAAAGWRRCSATAVLTRRATTATRVRTARARATTGTATRCRPTTADLLSERCPSHLVRLGMWPSHRSLACPSATRRAGVTQPRSYASECGPATARQDA